MLVSRHMCFEQHWFADMVYAWKPLLHFSSVPICCLPFLWLQTILLIYIILMPLAKVASFAASFLALTMRCEVPSAVDIAFVAGTFVGCGLLRLVSDLMFMERRLRPGSVEFGVCFRL